MVNDSDYYKFSRIVWPNELYLFFLQTEFFINGPTNIVVVDWGPLAIDGCYFDTAFGSIPLVGRCCASMLNAILTNRPEIKLDQIHVIGFSMGAQVCARFANFFKPKIIPRVTGNILHDIKHA